LQDVTRRDDMERNDCCINVGHHPFRKWK